MPHNTGYLNVKGVSVTRNSVEELVQAWRPRYLKAKRKEKAKILDEFVALSGYHRKAVIRLLRGRRRRKGKDSRGRPELTRTRSRRP